MEKQGYSEKIRILFSQNNIDVFDAISISLTNGNRIEGIVMPRPQYGDPDCIILKLKNGYNIGINIAKVKKIRLLKKYVKPILKKYKEINYNPSLPTVIILGTGGTIASRIDYKTGAVYPFYTPRDIYTMIPELEEIANIKVEMVFSIFSEDMDPNKWSTLAEKIYEKYLEEEISGIIVAHGTDTMGYTAAALSFSLRNLPGPVILVGAQRSSDRPSSDTILNLYSSFVIATKAIFGEVVVVMHGDTSDDIVLVHRGTRVRKCHTSRRDAFQSINSSPIAMVKDGEIVMLTKNIRKRVEGKISLENGFEEKVALIKFFPGMEGEIIDRLIDLNYKGIVIEGTGLGHVGKKLLKSIKRAIDEEIPVAITSQCIWGRVNLNVYRRGIELLKMGVIPCEDMLSETAFVKLSWVLYRATSLREIRKLMLKNIAYEISPRTQYNHYLRQAYFT